MPCGIGCLLGTFSERRRRPALACTPTPAPALALALHRSQRRTALHLAAWAGQLECVKALLAAGAEAGAAAQDDMNGLHFACVKGRTDVARWLLNSGVCVRAPGWRRAPCRRLLCMLRRPTHASVGTRRRRAALRTLRVCLCAPSAAPQLTTAGLKVNSKMRNGSNALMLAAKQGAPGAPAAAAGPAGPCASLRGAPPPTADGLPAAPPHTTPSPSHPPLFILLPPAGHRDTVELLLARKADPSATNRRGESAADLCKDASLKEALLAAQAARDASTAGSESGGSWPTCGV